MTYRTTLFSFLLFLCVSMPILSGEPEGAAASVRKPAGWYSGVGASGLSDPAEAGSAAALEAKEALGGVPAKFVMVVSARPLMGKALLDGVKQHFPAEVIYGGEVTCPWTPEGNYPDSTTLDVEVGVGVWAVGGDVEIVAASAVTDGDDDEEDAYYQAGVDLAGVLREPVEQCARPGKLVFTWGDQYTGSNKAFARGLNDGFGATYPIVGGAAGSAEAKVVVKGELSTGINVGVLLAGDFAIGMSKNTGPHMPRTADLTAREALSQGGGESPFFGLLFNCRRRRVGMMKEGTLREEHATILKYFPGGEFFGFYGPGEIGPAGVGEASEGVGFSVVAALLFALPE